MLALRNISTRLPHGLSTSFWNVGHRHYNGDPGPRTSAHRKSQRQRLRESVDVDPRKAQAISADTLGAILSGEAASASIRSPRKSVESGSRPRAFGRPHGNSIDGARNGSRSPVNSERRDDRPYGSQKGHSAGSSQQRFTPSSRTTHDSDSRYTRPYDRSTARPPPVRFTSSGDKTEVRNAEDPYTTGRLLKEHIQSCSSPMTDKQIEAAVKILEDAPKVSVNVVVWNMLLGMMGREGKLERMWKSFNDMKKAGIKPSAHTYTALLNSYAGLSHSHSPTPSSPASPISPKSLSRVAIIWSQARTYIDTHQLAPTGLDLPADTTPQKENLLGPVNAYLKFLARAGMWDEMWTVYQEDKGRGEVWDRVGYTTLVQALLLVARRQAADNKAGAIKQDKKLVGPMAREVWDDAVKHLGGKKGEEGGLDNPLAVLGVGMLMMGRPDDQRYAMGLIPAIWGLTPLPSSSAPVPTSITPSTDAGPGSILTPNFPSGITLPKLKLDVKTATTLIQCLTSASRPTLAAHYASLLLSTPYIRRRADPPFLYACTTAFADTGDPASALDLLNTFAPPAMGWKLGFWYDCLTAARWARTEGSGGGKGDWESMRLILGWMGYLKGVIQRPGEGGRKGGRDITGKSWPTVGMWERTKAGLGAKGMTIVLKTALGRGRGEVQEAIGILENAGVAGVLGRYQERLQQVEAMEKKWEWYDELSKEVVRAMERAGEEYISRETGEVIRRISRMKGEKGEVDRKVVRMGLQKAWKR